MTTQPETVMEQRVSRIEGVVEQINLRLAENHDDIQALNEKIDAKVDALNDKIDAKTDALNEKIDTKVEGLRSEMNARFNTVYVLLGGVWATMAGGFIALFLRG